MSQIAKKSQDKYVFFDKHDLSHTHCHNFNIQNALVPSMPDVDNNFGGSLVLDLRIS